MLGHRALSPEDYLAILKKRWWLIAIPALILPIVAFAASYLVPPQYTSQTLVLVEQQKVPDSIVKPVIEEDISGRLASMKEQILSRSRLQPILERFDLYAGSHLDMDDRIAKMQKDIGVKPIRSETARGVPGFFISFNASDARTAQAVCQEITSMFINENLRARAAQTEGTTEFLQNQLAEAKRNLDDQDSKLAHFQQEFAGRLPSDQDTNNNTLNSLNSQLMAATQQLDRMHQDKTLMESMLAQQAHELAVPVGQKASPQVQQTELQSLIAQEADLSSRYTDDYPDVVAVRRKIRDLRHQMEQAPAPSSNSAATPVPSDSPDLQRLRLQIHALDLGMAEQRRQQQDLNGQIASYRARLSSSPMVQEQYKNLTRDYQTTLSRYNELLASTNQTKMARDLESRQQGEQFSLVDAANLPDAPTSPKRPIFAAGGLFLGLLVGFGAVALLEYRNTALRSERDIWAFTKLPTLATISLMEDVRVDTVPSSGKPGGKWFQRKKSGAASADAPLATAGR